MSENYNDDCVDCDDSDDSDNYHGEHNGEDENEDLDKKRPHDSWGQVPTETMNMRMKIKTTIKIVMKIKLTIKMIMKIKMKTRVQAGC